MLFYGSIKRLNTIGGDIRYYVKTIKGFTKYLDIGDQYIAVIRGVVTIESVEDPVHYFVPNDTPYVIWREKGSRRNKCLYMKLDLRNPNMCSGGNLTSEQAVMAVSNAIKENGVSKWPSLDVRESFNLTIQAELRKHI